MVKWWVVVASGPSFRVSDAEALRGRCRFIAVNCAVFYVPWAEYLFAGDSVWWRYYGCMAAWYKGHRASRTHAAPNVEQWRGNGWPRTGGNSGHMALQYIIDKEDAKHIALLGFDQQKTGGKAHCHADHPKMERSGKRTNMANAGGIGAWPRLMARTSIDLQERGVTVVNLSRQTALQCFPRMTVEKFLEDVCP